MWPAGRQHPATEHQKGDRSTACALDIVAAARRRQVNVRGRFVDRMPPELHVDRFGLPLPQGVLGIESIVLRHSNPTLRLTDRFLWTVDPLFRGGFSMVLNYFNDGSTVDTNTYQT